MSITVFRQEKIASLAALSLLLFACYQVLRPFLFDLLWAGILCFVTWPVFQRLRQWGMSKSVAATLMILAIGTLILTPFAAAAFSFTEDINRLLKWLGTNNHQWPAAPDWLGNLPLVGDTAAQTWKGLADDSTRILDLARQYALSTSRWVLQQGLHLAGELMHMGLSLLVLFFLFRDGDDIANHAVLTVERLAGQRAQRILHIVRSSLRAVVYGILGTALAQALVSILGFMLVDVPYAFVLGALAFFLMIIPAAGTVLWLPIAGWLLFHGETGKAVFIAIWFLAFVGTIDNWLRPILISREVELPFVLIVFGIFGGLLAFGFIGLFLGPTLLATTYALGIDWLMRGREEERDRAAGLDNP
ncbi:MAG: AI-2E family transporter [Methylomonas sp.]|nr:AI-2E family transporter [Methylomonas sp.]PPD20162.1 MAG: hypothetical protein CTY23_09650 [Methylomonas sp.]PPD25354.1 MAG: hypothetical protein CTY22_09020 [Methylomonas sp.]PPD35371.1 MAG: hypothetical protein CTY21_09020 [Methylomonas sp.]PPD38339.1 MAG: hypothetical protein CTY17_09555 [Methylomonas sp.]